ncbi:GNAT family N-acetyltransferase [Streptomyces sp. NBC_01304]|uniref:GNAT family N-acetyltransferase n=1 Tax=Streptomyces sp. NBC_01304 TaxID=2903818 RepID=UPI002E10FEB1|nr:GNAT family N-acetyltransferase [Streptomyces sp. NBC_01304]
MRIPPHPDEAEESQPSPMDTVRLRRLNRWQAEDLREDLADLYVESSTTRPGEEFRGRQEFLHRLADNVQMPGFVMLIAEAQSVVGCAYGFPVVRDGSWWQGFDGPLPQNIEQLTASGHVFAITEVVVHPHGQHRGLARRLQERLLADHQASLGITSVDRSDRTACAALQSWGWQDVGEIRREPPGATALRVLVLPLGERTAEHPDGLAHNDRTQRPE